MCNTGKLSWDKSTLYLRQLLWNLQNRSYQRLYFYRASLHVIFHNKQHHCLYFFPGEPWFKSTRPNSINSKVLVWLCPSLLIPLPLISTLKEVKSVLPRNEIQWHQPGFERPLRTAPFSYFPMAYTFLSIVTLIFSHTKIFPTLRHRQIKFKTKINNRAKQINWT